MPKSYPEEIIKEAQKLVETTEMSYPEIAEQLDVARWMTVWDWKKKFNWDRAESSEPEPEMMEIWETIGEKALEHLQTGKFSSMTEAFKVYDQAQKHIKNERKVKDAGDTEAPVLKVLEKVESNSEVAGGEEV